MVRITLLFRMLLLVLTLIWPYLLNYSYPMLTVWMSYSVLLWMGLTANNCVLSILLAVRSLNHYKIDKGSVDRL